MDPQIFDWGGSVLVVSVLWPVIARSIKGLNRRLDRVEKGQAELKSDVAGLKEGQSSLKKDFAGLEAGQAELKSDVAGLKAGQSSLKSDVAGLKSDMREGQVRMEGHIIQLAGGLGEVKGELRRIAPREKVSAGGS